MTSTRGHWLPTLGKALFGLVMIGSMVLLVVMISTSAKEGGRAIDAWAERVRHGEPVASSVGGAEAEALATVLRASTSSSIDNFQSQSNTSCFWVTLDDTAKTELRVLLVDSKDTQVVAQASLARECECPDDSEKCQLK